ncbi:MAG TPA: hypothetical protein VKY92_20160 [Verrucomicrobiae bacterium]|nr:hypothetical protein [Verrucomicrobiae bacterium]
MLALLVSMATGAVLTFGVLNQAKAEDSKADASGTWTWTMAGRQGGPDRKFTAKLKVDGEKVTGKVSAPSRGGEMRETEIQDGKIKGDEISFSTSREMNGNTIVTKYSGKISGDSIKGKMEFERNGEPVKRDWEAKRGEAKEAK